MEEREKKEIQDAEIDTTHQEEEEKKKRNYKTEIVLILVIGFLLGAMIKAEAIKRVSVGFSDYKVIAKSQQYDIDAIEDNLAEEAAQESAAQEELVPAE
jgi:TctA family transporter